MDLQVLLPGIVGAFVGVIGWLGVGLYIQRRQFGRQARTAARAVYFELDVNRVAIQVARDYGSFAPLARSTFDRMLPELAMLLQADELREVVAAYMAHAGYQQAATNDDLPATVRETSLAGVLASKERAQALIVRRAFCAQEEAALVGADKSIQVATPGSPDMQEG
jgi:hypothetical protein